LAIFGKKDKSDDGAGEQALETYKVVYRGGLPHLPKAKTGEIRMVLTPAAFELNATIGSKSFWEQLVIPYDQVTDVKIVARQESGFERLLGGPNARNLNDENNIHVEYLDGDQPMTLRLEMLTGITVQGQAKKCREFDDRLRSLGIRARFRQYQGPGAAGTVDIPGQLAKLGELRDQGILTDAEFAAKKAELLQRM
jgi:Short C-terminal domain